MQKWIKAVEATNIEEGKIYFFAKTYGRGFDFWSQWKNGRKCWSGKPGIAMRFQGGTDFRADIERNQKKFDAEMGDKAPKFMAIEVPADADKRWRARK